MDIDNSAANTFRECPLKYFESYEAEGTGLEQQPFPGEGYSPLMFGSRVHELLEEHYNPLRAPYPESPNVALETEAQMMLAGYKTHYPVETWETFGVPEFGFKVPLPNSEHFYTGKIDWLVTEPENGHLSIVDHKTQKRGAKSNDPRKWAARDQATLYLWALTQLYPTMPRGNFYVNILTRQSDAGLIGATFPERQKLERTDEQIETAVRDITAIADQIAYYRKKYKDVTWPSNRENCYTWGYCPFYLPHTFGWSEEIRREKYQVKTPYLHIIQ